MTTTRETRPDIQHGSLHAAILDACWHFPMLDVVHRGHGTPDDHIGNPPRATRSLIAEQFGEGALLDYDSDKGPQLTIIAQLEKRWDLILAHRDKFARASQRRQGRGWEG